MYTTNAELNTGLCRYIKCIMVWPECVIIADIQGDSSNWTRVQCSLARHSCQLGFKALWRLPDITLFRRLHPALCAPLAPSAETAPSSCTPGSGSACLRCTAPRPSPLCRRRTGPEDPRRLRRESGSWTHRRLTWFCSVEFSLSVSLATERSVQQPGPLHVCRKNELLAVQQGCLHMLAPIPVVIMYADDERRRGTNFNPMTRRFECTPSFW